MMWFKEVGLSIIDIFEVNKMLFELREIIFVIIKKK